MKRRVVQEREGFIMNVKRFLTHLKIKVNKSKNKYRLSETK